MSGLPKKRSRENEALQDSPKRFYGETEQQILQMLEDGETLEKFQPQEECVASEELVIRFMRTLQEEIGLACSTSDEASGGSSGLSIGDVSTVSDMTGRYVTPESGIDVDYLLGASDDELGLPPSPLLNSEGELVSSSSVNDGCASLLDFSENAEHKGFVENWHYEDDFVDFRQFVGFENAAASPWDIVCQGPFIEEDMPRDVY